MARGNRLTDDEARACGLGHLIPKRAARATRATGKDERGMNKLEAKFSRYLDDRKHRGLIADYWFEGMKFRLATRTFLTPDFIVVLPHGPMEVYEVKGHWEDDARVKIKVAAEKYWHLRWMAVRWVNRNWEFEIISGRKTP